jgi:hypothetical protein
VELFVEAMVSPSNIIVDMASKDNKKLPVPHSMDIVYRCIPFERDGGQLQLLVAANPCEVDQ